MRKLSVLVTRPDPQGSELCAALNQDGDIALHFPTIEFAPPDKLDDLRDHLDKLGQCDWLIFISPQAVRAGVPYLRQHWPVLPERVKLAAIGGGTAKALGLAGYSVTAVPKMDWRTEGLLALPEFQALENQSVAVIRGEAGRPDLEQALTARGASVLPIPVYRRVLATEEVSPCLTRLKNRQIDVIICTSQEGVQNLKILIGAEHWPWLRSVPLLVAGERVRQLAIELDFAVVWSVDRVSVDEFRALLENKREAICQSNQTRT